MSDIKQFEPKKELVSRLYLESFRELSEKERQVLMRVIEMELTPLFVVDN